MTSSARSAPTLLVDVQEMKVYVSISEIGQIIGLGRPDHGLGMAAKTQGVIVLREWRVEYGWIIFGQKAEIFAAVRNMATAAIILGNRTMQEFLIFKLFGESRQNLIFVYPLGLIVARYA
jgi:hypothetical protein